MALGNKKKSSKSKLTVDKVSTLILNALGKSAPTVIDYAEFFERLAGWRGQKQCEAHPESDTIIGWKKNRKTRINLASALLFSDYIEELQSNDQVDQIAFISQLRRDLAGLLATFHDERFAPPKYNLPAQDDVIGRYTGVYVLVREETSNNTYYQELLVLSCPSRERRFATYISESIVCRGQWHLVEDAVYCQLAGLAGGSKVNIVSIALEREQFNDIMGGLVAGTKTASTEPVCMPLLAIRIQNVTDEVKDLGNFGDAYILNHYKAQKIALKSELVSAMTKQLFSRVELSAGGLVADLRGKISDPVQLLSPDFVSALQGEAAA